MASASFYRIVLFALLGVLAALTAFFGHWLWRGYNEYTVAQERLDQQRGQLEQARTQYAINEAFLNKLLSDREFFERVVRERLGYTKDNEFVFRFPEDGAE